MQILTKNKKLLLKTVRSTFSVLLTVLLVFLCGCTAPVRTDSFFAMNTIMQTSFYSLSAKQNDELNSELENEAARLEKLFSITDDNSEISRINASESGTEVSPDTAGLIKAAIAASEMTDGTFDCTICPVLKLWGFTDGLYSVPANKALSEALKLTDYKKISVNGNTVEKGRGQELAAGGIAKGYLGDKLLSILNEKGVSGVLSLGGNIVLAGEKPDKSQWIVEVKSPLDSEKAACTVLLPGNISVVTSGGYERYFEKDGKTYHHIIDPKTGRPSDSGLLSATVIGADGTLCDAFSTAAFVMGEKKAVEFFGEHSGFLYILITANNRLVVSPSLKDSLKAGDGFTLD